MAWPQSSSWIYEGDEAAEFLNKIFQEKPQNRSLLTQTKQPIENIVTKVKEYVESSEK